MPLKPQTKIPAKLRRPVVDYCFRRNLKSEVRSRLSVFSLLHSLFLVPVSTVFPPLVWPRFLRKLETGHTTSSALSPQPPRGGLPGSGKVYARPSFDNLRHTWFPTVVCACLFMKCSCVLVSAVWCTETGAMYARQHTA